MLTDEFIFYREPRAGERPAPRRAPVGSSPAQAAPWVVVSFQKQLHIRGLLPNPDAQAVAGQNVPRDSGRADSGFFSFESDWFKLT